MVNNFRVRNGYGDPYKPLIEFVTVDEKQLGHNLQKVFRKIGAETTGTWDLWQNDEMIYDFQCDKGRFEVSSSASGAYFIQCLDDSNIIQFLADALEVEDVFKRVE